MNVVLIGSGNVATVLGRLIKSSGHAISEVMSRNAEHAYMLAKELNAQAFTNIHHLTKDADIYIIAVSDNAIKTVAKDLLLKNKIVVHTSGPSQKNVLQHSSDHFGVLYPLQSLRKESVYIPDIPLLIDGNTPETIQLIQSFAISLSEKVHYAEDEERLKLHVAAVMVSNFTNHLYALAKEYCAKEATDFSLLTPLINEVAERVATYEPASMQTGPAIRNDAITIEKHLDILRAHPQLEKLYEAFTESIQKFHAEKNKK